MSRKEIGYDLNGNNKIKMFKDIDLNFEEAYLETDNLRRKDTESFLLTVSDETTPITTGTSKLTFRVPYNFTITDVRASVTIAPTGAPITVDINNNGVSILSTKLTIDSSEFTSTTAIIQRAISDSDLPDDSQVTIDIDTVGSTIAGAGLKVSLIGRNTTFGALIVDISNSNLNAYNIDARIIALDSGEIEGGFLYYEDNPDSPTGESLTAYNNLASKGWAITGDVPVSTNLYFVDATNGADTNDGLTVTKAFKTIDKVNGLSLTTNNTVYFVQDTYRGNLLCQEGVEYRGYSTREVKPVFLGSIDVSDDSEWTEVSTNIWQKDFLDYNITATGANLITNSTFDTGLGDWIFNSQSPATKTIVRDLVDFHSGIASAKFTCDIAGNSFDDLQIYSFPDIGNGFNVVAGEVYSLKYWAKTSKIGGFALETTKMQMKSEPRTNLTSVVTNSTPTITTTWAQHESLMYCNLTSDDGQIRWQMGTTLEAGETLWLDDITLNKVGEYTDPLVDAGFLIGDDTTVLGDIKHEIGDVVNDGDFYYNLSTVELNVFSTSNPGLRFTTLEVSNRLNMITSALDNVRINNLELKYGASHGVRIEDCADNTVDYCKLTYIGGAYLIYSPTWLRYGNAIEMWGNSDGHRIENNYIEEIYDSGVTFQGDNVNVTVMNDLAITNNTIRKCGLANFEFWQTVAGSSISNILYEYNKSEFAGLGWGGDVRPSSGVFPEQEGYDVLQFPTDGSITNFIIRNNSFLNAKGAVYVFSIDTDRITVENNNITKLEDSLVSKYEGDRYYMSDTKVKTIAQWKSERNKDVDSTFTIL